MSPAKNDEPWAVCSECGQQGNRPPGFRVYDVGPEAIFVGEELAMVAPVWLECRSCGHRRMVPGTMLNIVKRPAGACQARRPGRGDGPCDGPVKFQVVYRTSSGAKGVTVVPGCFKHAMAECDRAHSAGTMARVDVEPIPE